MKIKNHLSKLAALFSVTMLTFAVSCVDEVVPYQEEAAYVSEDAITDAYFEDADDMAGVVMLSDAGTDDGSGGKIKSTRPIDMKWDHRFKCDGVVVTITITDPNPEHPIGDISIDFGTEGCTDARGNVRKGIINIHFDGRRFISGSTVTTTFDGYEINGIQLEGTRVLTNVSTSTQDLPKFQVELTDGKATWPDGTTATRNHCIVRQWILGNTRLEDRLEVSACPDVTPTAYGTNRRGVEYQMTIIEPLVYKRACPFMAVSGVKQFVAEGKTITIDYGDGECDRIVVITIDGRSRDVRVGNR